jgi:type II secretory ATPase GspE/PulE/Tfp pilus assembly ATPase PilB-like protein
MMTIRESAIMLMKKGITTLEEVTKETLYDKPLAEFKKK